MVTIPRERWLFPAPKVPVPASCAGLDLDVVVEVLAKHCGNVSASAKELGVPITDLRKLTWAKPKLLPEALDMADIITRSKYIQDLYSNNVRRRERAVDKILAWPGSPFAPAPAQSAPSVRFRWAEADEATDKPPGKD